MTGYMPAAGAQAPAAHLTGPASIAEPLLRLRRPMAPDYSQSGRIAFSVSQFYRQPDGSVGSEIWVTHPDRDESAPIGVGGALPKWDPEGTSIAFCSDADTPGRYSAVLIRNLLSGDQRRLVDVAGSIEDLIWEGDGSLLVLVADPGAPTQSMFGAITPAANGDPAVIVPAQHWRRIFRLSIATGDLTELPTPGWAVWELARADSHRLIAVASEDPSENGWYASQLVLVNLDTGDVRPLYRPLWQIACPAISPNLERAAVIEGWASDRGLVMGELRVVDVASGSVRSVTLPEGDTTWIRWRDHDSIWFAGVRGLESAYGWLDLAGNHRIWTEKATMRSRYQAEIAPNHDGTEIAAVLDRFEQPWELARRTVLDGDWRRVTELNHDIADALPPRRIRSLEWLATDGLRLEGLLVEPAGSSRPRPIVINARGGPSWPFRWGTIPLQASAAVNAGYAVLMPNPRGSPGRGAEFNTAIIGKPGFDEVEDMLAGVDECVREGVDDGRRVAIMGGSWAGYLTALAVATRSDRLRCAIMMYGLSNLVSFHRTSYEPRFTEFLLQELPRGEAGVGRYMKYSPLTYVSGRLAPTLILHGELDQCTPLGQGTEFYQALAETGTEVELVVYPREGHSASNWEHGHQLDLAQRVVAWLHRYLESPSLAE